MGAKPRKRASGKAYFLEASFGGEVLPIDPTQLRGVIINMDINEFLPSLKFRIDDSGSILSIVLPVGTFTSSFILQLGRDTGIEDTTKFEFDVYRRFPSSLNIFDIEGLLKIKKYFAPNIVKGYPGSIYDSLESIAFDLGVDEVEISASLKYEKCLIQPNWTNKTFLSYLKNNLIGKTNESGFYCFIKCVNQKKVFVFKSLNDFITTPYKYSFTDSKTNTVSKPLQGKGEEELLNPIISYKVFDNIKLLTASGSRVQNFAYFDFENSEMVIDSVGLTDLSMALTHRYMVTDDVNDTDNVSIDDNGRGNCFTQDFKSKALNHFSKKINNLSRIVIMTLGIEDIYPGDTVRLLFLYGNIGRPDFISQFQGFWLVERITHICGTNFYTQLTLMRCGIDESPIYDDLGITGLAKTETPGSGIMKRA